jgi:hypothetical protein
MGVLRLALRNYKDAQIVLTRAIDVDDVMNAYTPKVQVVGQLVDHVDHGRSRAPAIKRPPPPVPVEILRNGKSSEMVEFIDRSAERRQEYK